MTDGSPSQPAENRDFTRKALTVIGLSVLAFLLLALLYQGLHVFLLLFTAILLAVLLSNLARKVHHFTRLPYGLSLLAVCLLLLAILLGLVWVLAPQLTEQSQELAEQLPRSIERLRERLQNLPYGHMLLSNIPEPQKLVEAQSNKETMKKVLSFFSSGLGMLIDTIIVVVVGLYLATSPKTTTEGLIKLVPLKKRHRAREVLHACGYTLWGWLKGTLLAMLVIGTLTAVGLSIIGVPLALLLGVFAGLLEFVPNIGPFIAGAPAVLLAFADDPAKALYVILFFVALQSLEGYVITPLVQKRMIELPPILTILAQVLLGLLVGGLGVLLATPIIAVVQVLVKMLYIQDVLGDREITVKGTGQDEAAPERKGWFAKRR